MAGLDFLGNAYSKIEGAYYNLLNWFEEKGIPLFAFNDFLESRGIPGFPATLAIILIIIGVIAGVLYLNSGMSVAVQLSFQDNLGNTLNGVTLSINDKQTQKSVFSGTVSSNGKINLEGVKRGQSLEVIAQKEGYEQSQPIPLVITSQQESLDIQLTRTQRTATAQFRLADSENGTLIGKANVTANFQGEDIPVSVDENGTITLSGVPVGEQITLHVKANNYENLDQTIAFDGTSVPTLQLSPKAEATVGTSTLIVSVVEKAGQSLVKGARIQVYDSVSGSLISDAISNDGYYSTDLPNGKVIRLVGSAEGFAPYDSAAEGKTLAVRSDYTWKIELEAGSLNAVISVSDKVSGSPLAGATVQLYNALGEKLDENLTQFGGQVEFRDLNATANYFAAAVLSGYLPQRQEFVPSQKKELGFGLESANKGNSVTLNVFVSENTKKAANNAAVNFYGEMDDNSLLPLGALEQKTDLSGYASAVVPNNAKIYVKAVKGGQVAEGSIAIKAFEANELRLIFPGATGIIALTAYGNDGKALMDGEIEVTSDNGNVLYSGQLNGESIFFDAEGSKWIGVQVKTIDGQSYSEKFDAAIGDQIDFKIGAKESTGLAPQINLLRIEDLQGNEAIGITRGKEYYLVFETIWAAGNYSGGIHVRAGNDETRFVDSQGIGITGYQGQSSGDFYGRSYYSSPLPGNEGIDSKNAGKAGQYSKFVEVYFTNPEGVKIVKVRLKAKETAPEELQEIHYRAWANFDGAYYRSPADEVLNLSQYNQQKSSLYATTVDATVQIFESLPDCSQGLCTEFRFVDENGMIYDQKGFEAIKGKNYALEAGLVSIKSDLGPDVKVQTTNQNPLIGFTGQDIGSGGAFPQAGKTDTEMPFTRVALQKGEKTVLRAYFTARETGSAFIKFTASAGTSVVAKQLNFNIAKENRMKLDYQLETALGQTMILKAIDSETSDPLSGAQLQVYDSQGKLVETIIGNGATGKGAGGAYALAANYSAGQYAISVSAQGYAGAKATFSVSNSNAFQLPDSITINVLKGGQPVTMDLALKNKLALPLTNLTFEVAKDSAWPDGMELLVQGPQALDKMKSVNLKATASYSGNLETEHAEAEVTVRGIAAGSYSVSGKTRVIIEYNKPFSADCLELNPPEALVYLVGTIGNNKSIEIQAKNNCPIALNLEPQVVSPDNSQGITVQAAGIAIEKGKTQTIRIQVLNAMPRIVGSQQGQQFTVYLKSDQLEKSIPLNVILWDPSYALETNDNIMVWLSSFGTQKEAVAEVPLLMRNNGPEPIYNLRVTNSAGNLQGIQLVMIPSYPIQVLAAGQSLFPPIILHASTKQSKSQYVRSELIIQGQVGGQSFPLRTVNVFFNVSAPSCVEIKTPGDPVDFSSGEAGYGTIDKTVTVFNHCSESVRVAPELTPSQLEGGNQIMLQPLVSDTLSPNSGAEFKLTLVKNGAAKRSTVSVVGHAFMLGSQAWADTQRFNVSLSLGEKELPQEMSGSTVQMQSCEKPLEFVSVKFPKLAVGNDCANGYCDAEQLAGMLSTKIAESVSQAKFKALAANKAVENTPGCLGQKGYCTFDDLGVQAKSFGVYFSNDSLAPEMITAALAKNSALSGYDSSTYAGTEESMAGIARSGYQNRVFVSSTIQGCAKYVLRVNGTMPIISDQIVDAPNVFVEVLDRRQTGECKAEIENFLNFIPSDAGYSYEERKGSWLGTTDSAPELADAAKTIASQLFGKPERYVPNSSSNRVLLKLGDIKGIVRLGIDTAAGDGTKTVTAIMNNSYKTATKDETKKQLADEAARAIKAFRDKSTTACISNAKEYIEVKSFTEIGKLRLNGCGAIDTPDGVGELTLVAGIENCCRLKASAEVEQSITAKQLTPLDELGGGVSAAKIAREKAPGSGTYENFSEADYIKLDFNKQSKLFERNFLGCVTGKEPVTLSNAKKFSVEVAATISNERNQRSVSLKACAVHPTDLYKQLLSGQNGDYYATIQWKAGPEEFSSDDIAQHLYKSKWLEDKSRSVTSQGNSVPLGKAFESQLKTKKMEALVAYGGTCLAACGVCNTVGGAGIGILKGALECGLICGPPVVYEAGTAQGLWNASGNADSVASQESKGTLIAEEIGVNVIAISTVIGASDSIGKVVSSGMQESLSNKIASLIANGTEGLSSQQAAQVAAQIQPEITKGIPVGTVLSDEVLSKAATAGIDKAAANGINVTGSAAGGSALASAVGKASGTLESEAITKIAKNAVGGRTVQLPAWPSGSAPSAGGQSINIYTGANPGQQVQQAQNIPLKLSDTPRMKVAGSTASDISSQMVEALNAKYPGQIAKKTSLKSQITKLLKNEIASGADAVTTEAIENSAGRVLANSLNSGAAGTLKTAIANDVTSKAMSQALATVGKDAVSKTSLMKKTRLGRIVQSPLRMLKSFKFWRTLGCGVVADAAGYGAWEIYWNNASGTSLGSGKDNTFLADPTNGTLLRKGHTYKFEVKDDQKGGKQVIPGEIVDPSKIPGNAKWLPEKCTGNEWEKELGFGKASSGTVAQQASAAPSNSRQPLSTAEVQIQGVDKWPSNLEACKKYAGSMDKYVKSYGLEAKGFNLLNAATLAYQESSCDSSKGLFQLTGDMRKSAGNDADKQAQYGLKFVGNLIDLAQSDGAGQNAIDYALFGYNRGGSAMTKAIQYEQSGKSQKEAMVLACKDYYSSYGGCSGLSAEKCCNGAGYGANYPDVVLAHYSKALDAIENTA